MSYVVEGPQFGVLGWISLKDFPRGGAGVFHDCVRDERNLLTASRLRLFYGCKALFASGNQPPPPVAFADELEFEDFLAGKNYRSALSISRVRLQCSDAGAVEDVDFEFLEDGHVGFTPYRAGTIINYSQGEGFPSEVTETPAIDHVTVSQCVYFRIGRIGQLLGKLTTNYFPPYAWLNLSYEIYAAGYVTAHVTGSCIPNRTYYLNWSRISTDDMERALKPDVMRFLRKRKRATAPSASYYCVSASAQKVVGTL